MADASRDGVQSIDRSILAGCGFQTCRLRGWLSGKWLWQSKKASDKPWLHLPICIDTQAWALFNAAVQFNLGDGLKINFWHDPWLDGVSIVPLLLFKHCTNRSICVAHALHNYKCTTSNVTCPTMP
jgi:hypothetical protein